MTPAVADQGEGLDPFSNPGFPISCWVPEDLTVRLMEAECVVPPPVAVTVRVWAPTVAVEPADMVSVADPEPGAAIDEGLKPAVTPEGRPEADNDKAELKPPEIVLEIVELPEAPCEIVSDDGDAAIEKSGTAADVTVSPSVVVWVFPPPVAVIVTVDVPVGVDEAADTVRVADPEPGAPIDVGLNVAVAPEGSPEAESEIDELNVPDIVVDTVELALPPC